MKQAEPELFFRPMKKGEGKSLVGMMKKLDAFDGASGGKYTAPFFEASCVGKDRSADVWFACLDKQIVGFLLIEYRINVHAGQLYGFLHKLFVEEAFRGQGIGQCLLAVAAKETTLKKGKNVTLYASKKNKRSNKIYREAGFKLMAPVKPFFNTYVAENEDLRKLAK